MILLDTHVWVWWIGDPERLSKKALTAIENAISLHAAYVSSISAWEVAVLAKKGRLQLTVEVRDWIGLAESLPSFRFVPVDNRIAVNSVFLKGEVHDDPADRIIIATALALGASLVTKDKRIRGCRWVDTIW
ncbi:MAG: type II toxin-antitoxin system VapC family toxin [Armatimonadetes bacterium]|nr:type II toxin-antitoxin system VapC family toxin [Armatimonadota bacterium]